MALALLSVTIRSARRIRLVFTQALAGGAFLTGFYVVTTTDGIGVSPLTVAALGISADPNQVELVLDADLASGGGYLATCTAVPAISGGPFTGAEPFSLALNTTSTNVEPETQDADYVLYGTDLVYDGQDFVELQTGDLATISGLANVKGALTRRCKGKPLPWDDTYGARASDYVDAPPGEMATLAGRLVAQVKADDRVKSATASFAVNPNDPTNAVVSVRPVLIGDKPAGEIGVRVQPS